MNLYIIAGIRSHFIKLSALLMARKKLRLQKKINVVLINSGQHYDYELAGQYIDEFQVKFDFDFTNKYIDLHPIAIFGDMVKNLYSCLSSCKKENSAVLVFGDANTTLAGALAAAKSRHAIIHVEAGVRNRNIKEAEEQNRICTDHLSTLRFAASMKDLNNLRNEGLAEKSWWVGDILYDFINFIKPELDRTSLPFENNYGDYVLATMHREENILSERALTNLLPILNSYKKPVIFITHPRTRQILESIKNTELSNVMFINALSYKQALTAIKRSYFVITDSGGIQREAYYLGKRCLVRQDYPFWPSLLTYDINRQIEMDADSILSGIDWIEHANTSTVPKIPDLGDGNAFRHIFSLIEENL